MNANETIKIVSVTRTAGKVTAMQIVVITDKGRKGKTSITRHLRASGPDWMGVVRDPSPRPELIEFTQYDVNSALSRW